MHQTEQNSTQSQRVRYERRQIKTLCMAHYQWVYGKITQPSDKRAVIDSELETSAPAEADGSTSHCFLNYGEKKESKNMSILKQSYFSGLQSFG